MQLGWLQSHFDNSSSIGLLRATHAPYLIDFFIRQFKSGEQATARSEIHRGMEDLTRALGDYLEQLHDTHPDVLTDTAEHYLADWCSSKKRYLRRFLDLDADEPLYELTSSTEDVLTFLDQVARRETQFVGTESRLKRIIEALADLAIGSSEDIDARLRHLRTQRLEIDEQIRELESGGDVETYHETAIRERFAAAMSDLVQLQGDFRAVEDRFKEITRDVQKRQLTSDATRGEILGEALDAEEGLKGEDQGISFDEFARLILSPAKQEHLDGVIREVVRLESLADDRDGILRVRDMVPALTAEARKVLRTYQRLSTTLRRLLDRDARSSRHRLGQVLREIRSQAVRLADHPRREDACQVEIDHELDIFLPLERPLWSPPTEFESIEMRSDTIDDDDRLAAFSDLAMLKSLDWNRLRSRIAEGTACGRDVPLVELINGDGERVAGENDAVDVLGLIQIAHEDNHRINHNVRCRLRVQLKNESEVELDVPEVTYIARSQAEEEREHFDHRDSDGIDRSAKQESDIS